MLVITFSTYKRKVSIILSSYSGLSEYPDTEIIIP